MAEIITELQQNTQHQGKCKTFIIIQFLKGKMDYCFNSVNLSFFY